MRMSGYTVDPVRGIVYGIRGRPIRKVGPDGYMYIVNSARKLSYSVHRFIWESVYGPIPHGLQINHINGVKSDNRICNLELVTPSENTVHAYRNGLASASGEHNGRAKLTRDVVARIRTSSIKASLLANLYQVSTSTIYSIRSGKSWSRLA